MSFARLRLAARRPTLESASLPNRLAPILHRGEAAERELATNEGQRLW